MHGEVGAGDYNEFKCETYNPILMEGWGHCITFYCVIPAYCEICGCK